MEGILVKLAHYTWNWRVKALLPVAAVLLLGLVFFEAATLSLETGERYRVILVAASGALAILGVLMVVLARLIQRPLMELQAKIARLREGDLTVTVDFARRNDEIGELGRHFNETVRQLRESRDELEHLHQQQMSRAEHLATLGELAAGLAHEIRNPLAGIAGVVEIIGRELPGESSSRGILKEVQHEITHIQEILNDLLSYARPKPPRPFPADLNDTAEHAVALARQQILARPITINFSPSPGLPAVEHDPVQIRQVLVNLLLNAIQSIQGTGQVGLALGLEDSLAVIRVSDTGRGIPPEYLAKIFRPFFSTKRHGTGLGLSLARGIVEDHGGWIEVSSEVGRGTEFTIRLPVRRPANQQAGSSPTVVK